MVLILLLFDWDVSKLRGASNMSASRMFSWLITDDFAFLMTDVNTL